MATENQCKFFKSLYDEESQRTTLLAEHAKNNLGLSTLYSAFMLFVVEKELKSLPPLSKGLFIAAVVSMLVAFLLSLWSTQIAAFEAVTNPDDVFADYTDEPTDEEFFEDRIAVIPWPITGIRS